MGSHRADQDLGDALGFFVDYDKETRTVIIEP